MFDGSTIKFKKKVLKSIYQGADLEVHKVKTILNNKKDEHFGNCTLKKAFSVCKQKKGLTAQCGLDFIFK